MSEENTIDKMYRKLARRLCVAFQSCMLNVTYNTADKHTGPEEEIGELWIELARLAIEQFRKTGFFGEQVKHQQSPTSPQTNENPERRYELLETGFNMPKLARAI